GGGSDNYACAVTINDTNVPANGTEPISATKFVAMRIATNGGFFSTLGPVFFSTQPTDEWNYVGKSTTFSISLDGNPPYIIQSFRNGNPISGANASTYTTAPVALTDDGSIYTVSVSNNF